MLVNMLRYEDQSVAAPQSIKGRRGEGPFDHLEPPSRLRRFFLGSVNVSGLIKEAAMTSER